MEPCGKSVGDGWKSSFCPAVGQISNMNASFIPFKDDCCCDLVLCSFTCAALMFTVPHKLLANKQSFKSSFCQILTSALKHVNMGWNLTKCSTGVDNRMLCSKVWLLRYSNKKDPDCSTKLNQWPGVQSKSWIADYEPDASQAEREGQRGGGGRAITMNNAMNIIA